VLELASMKKKLILRDFPDSQKRREALEKELKIKLENISQFSFTEEQVTGRNIENLIGATQMPLGLAGPLKIRSTVNDKLYTPYIPLATTEGALVASVSRGCKAISASGGAAVQIEDAGMTRGPVFKTKGIEHGQKIKNWIISNTSLLAQVCQKTSSHLKLLKINCQIVGKSLFVRFSYLTGDAMGMNMVTFATEEAASLIEKETGASVVSLAGNFDIDKKPAWLNFYEGRGKKVWAEAILPKKIVFDVLKTSPEKITQVVEQKNHLGSIMSGSMGFNAHFANIAAGIFLATGQDPAHIVEASLGITTAEVLENGDLYFSIYLPSLVVGIVGGGTSLPTQKESLEIMKVKNVLEFAGVISGAILAGELSLIASLSEGTLAKAHKKLGRKGE
jgi:hydroxymethylglutaryl-CoA reductase (NADPH)